MHRSFVRSDRTYGARRVWHDVLEQGQACGLHRIERLMREQALRARPRRRGLPKDRGARSAVADNVLNRQFQADGPNQKWVADFTYIWTAEGWLYVAAVLDLYSRRIVGWSMQESMTSQLVVDALMMAVWRRGKPVALLHHSDQGSQGGFNRSSQHRVKRRILGSHSVLPLVSSSPTSCVACCSVSMPRLQSLARSTETGRCPWGSTGAAGRSCSRWCRAAMDCADRQRRPSSTDSMVSRAWSDSSLPRSQVNDCQSWVGSFVTVLLRALAMVMAP